MGRKDAHVGASSLQTCVERLRTVLEHDGDSEARGPRPRHCTGRAPLALENAAMIPAARTGTREACRAGRTHDGGPVAGGTRGHWGSSNRRCRGGSQQASLQQPTGDTLPDRH